MHGYGTSDRCRLDGVPASADAGTSSSRHLSPHGRGTSSSWKWVIRNDAEDGEAPGARYRRGISQMENQLDLYLSRVDERWKSWITAVGDWIAGLPGGITDAPLLTSNTLKYDRHIFLANKREHPNVWRFSIEIVTAVFTEAGCLLTRMPVMCGQALVMSKAVPG